MFQQLRMFENKYILFKVRNGCSRLRKWKLYDSTKGLNIRKFKKKSTMILQIDPNSIKIPNLNPELSN